MRVPGPVASEEEKQCVMVCGGRDLGLIVVSTACDQEVAGCAGGKEEW